ncbi:MAG: ABC transporter permease, partial [Planctomycetota bacterium]
MSAFGRAFSVELLKARRSKVPLLTGVAISLGPIVGAIFMLILKDPEGARDMGIIGTKALLTGSADWETLFGLLAQIVCMGGTVVFAFITAWVFGREFADRTVRQLLAVPTSRVAVVAAKFSVAALWSAVLAAWVFLLGTVLTSLVGLPGLTIAGVAGALRHVSGTAAMTVALITLVAFVAGVGRGYLPALGFAILTLFLGQIAAALGWGAWVPWSVPA